MNLAPTYMKQDAPHLCEFVYPINFNHQLPEKSLLRRDR